jgi:hypothetical protein
MFIYFHFFPSWFCSFGHKHTNPETIVILAQNIQPAINPPYHLQFASCYFFPC